MTHSQKLKEVLAVISETYCRTKLFTPQELSRRNRNFFRDCCIIESPCSVGIVVSRNYQLVSPQLFTTTSFKYVQQQTRWLHSYCYLSIRSPFNKDFIIIRQWSSVFVKHKWKYWRLLSHSAVVLCFQYLHSLCESQSSNHFKHLHVLVEEFEDRKSSTVTDKHNDQRRCHFSYVSISWSKS